MNTLFTKPRIAIFVVLVVLTGGLVFAVKQNPNILQGDVLEGANTGEWYEENLKEAVKSKILTEEEASEAEKKLEGSKSGPEMTPEEFEEYLKREGVIEDSTTDAESEAYKKEIEAATGLLKGDTEASTGTTSEPFEDAKEGDWYSGFVEVSKEGAILGPEDEELIEEIKKAIDDLEKNEGQETSTIDLSSDPNEEEVKPLYGDDVKDDITDEELDDLNKDIQASKN